MTTRHATTASWVEVWKVGVWWRVGNGEENGILVDRRCPGMTSLTMGGLDPGQRRGEFEECVLGLLLLSGWLCREEGSRMTGLLGFRATKEGWGACTLSLPLSSLRPNRLSGPRPTNPPPPLEARYPLPPLPTPPPPPEIQSEYDSHRSVDRDDHTDQVGHVTTPFHPVRVRSDNPPSLALADRPRKSDGAYLPETDDRQRVGSCRGVRTSVG